MQWNNINRQYVIIGGRAFIYPLSEAASVGVAAADAAAEAEPMKVGVGTGAAWMPDG